jgi:signal transduction histidine kinase
VKLRPTSLKWRLVWRLVPLQAVILTLFVMAITATMRIGGQFVDDAGIPLTTEKFLHGLTFVVVMVILPNLALMTVATLIATPIVIRRALASLSEAAVQAESIDIGQPGTRMIVASVPDEINPLVRAFNDALGRLDDGYERQRRFLADAAHELRTPIAILQIRLESLADSFERTRLLEDGARLAALAEQLLDLQRLSQPGSQRARVDLVAIGQRVTMDLAPLAINAGYAICFEPEVEHVPALGDELSLARAVMNLIQNAIEHGGRQGMITVRVGRSGTITVSDEGVGIPLDQRERIFEPFHRLQPRPRGAGLGLNLVREIVRWHHGDITVVDAPRGGASFKITLPLAAAK